MQLSRKTEDEVGGGCLTKEIDGTRTLNSSL